MLHKTIETKDNKRTETTVHSNGNISSIRIFNKKGIIDGPVQNFYSNGEIFEEGNYFNGMKNGHWLWYIKPKLHRKSPENEYKISGEYLNDKADGLWTIYNKTEDITVFINFVENKITEINSKSIKSFY